MPVPRSCVFRLAGLLCLLGAVGCEESSPEEPERPVVAVSVPPLAWLVEQLAHAWVELEVLIPPGASPAVYEPSMKQIRAMAEAELYVKVGHPKFPFERAWLDRLIAGHEDIQVVDCSRGVDTSALDPHLWLSPRVMRDVVPRLAEALQRLLPERAEALAGRREALLRRLDALDASLRETLAPVKGRRFYVFHPAWGYFAEAYGLQQVPIQRGAHEPDVHALDRVIEQARASGAEVIFVQPQFSERSAQLVAESVDARVETLDPLARDWERNLRRVASVLREALR